MFLHGSGRFGFRLLQLTRGSMHLSERFIGLDCAVKDKRVLPERRRESGQNQTSGSSHWIHTLVGLGVAMFMGWSQTVKENGAQWASLGGGVL
jgi:hypothetical protein